MKRVNWYTVLGCCAFLALITVGLAVGATIPQTLDKVATDVNGVLTSPQGQAAAGIATMWFPWVPWLVTAVTSLCACWLGFRKGKASANR